ncbi:MAG: DUF1573 domain-containing protein [Sedimentisphaerales bacterium]|nr:DUF1573 domain-containing protein [Sedimentisphaerales bacterium]
MKPNKTISIVIAIFLLYLQFGCEEDVSTQQNSGSDWFKQMTTPMQSTFQRSTTAPAVKRSPKITFDKLIHNFGNVGPATTHICQFGFTNTGNDTLEIIEVEQTCGCTPFVLSKKEYAPGEKGSLKVGFFSDTQVGPTSKPIYVISNDETNPEVELAIKADIKAKIDYEPKKLDLLLMQPNGSCPSITIYSLDNKPFSITSFNSTYECVTADFDPSKQATKFVLQPKIDMQKLERALDGRFEIGLSHPEMKKISGTFSTPPRFTTSPSAIMVHQANPLTSVTKKVNIISNYGEDFDIDSTLSQTGVVKAINKSKTRDGYELELVITPPATNNKARVFSDIFSLNLRGAGELQISCNGFYSGTKSSSTKTTVKARKCKSCKPILINK